MSTSRRKGPTQHPGKQVSASSMDDSIPGYSLDRLPLQEISNSHRHSFSTVSRPSQSDSSRNQIDTRVKSHSRPRGFTDLSPVDRRNFLLLCLLYFLQGAPMGFIGAAIPLLPEFQVDYSKVGILSLAMYPYSLKLLWSPIVDAVFNTRIGRRKSWILPIQTLSGIGLLWLGMNIDSLIDSIHSDKGTGIWGFTLLWIFLIFCCATQDIAVDGMYFLPCNHCVCKFPFTNISPSQ